MLRQSNFNVVLRTLILSYFKQKRIEMKLLGAMLDGSR